MRLSVYVALCVRMRVCSLSIPKYANIRIYVHVYIYIYVCVCIHIDAFV